MWELVPIIVFTVVIMIFAEKRSVIRVGASGSDRYIKKDRLFFVLLAVGLTLFVGLRTRYNDTPTYRGGYEAIRSSWSSFGKIDWALGSNPGFILTETILRILGVSTQGFLMFFAIITVFCYVWFIRKYTTSVWQSIFLYLAAGGYFFSLAALKQCFAIALCLVATDRMLRKKWVSFVLLVLLASTFHPYALMYLVTPFLCFGPWSKRTYLMVAIFLMIGLCLQPLIGTIIDITTMLGEEYTVEDFSGAGVNVFRFLVGLVPIVLAYFVRNKIQKSEDRALNLSLNLTMLHGVILFVALFGTANYFARLSGYFSIFTAISLPWLLRFFEPKSRRLLTFAMVILYTIFICYDLNCHGSFDSHYDYVTLWQYLKIVFGKSG